MAAPINNPMAAAVDPYASIRNLSFYQINPGSAAGTYDTGDGSAYRDAVAAQWGIGSSAADSGNAYNAFRASGFESKYGTPTVSPDGNTMTIELQGPDGHKYDTMTAVYTRGADGQWTLSNDPRQQVNRQVSSGERWRDTAEAFAPMAAMAAGGALYGAYGGGGTAASGGISSADAAAALGGAETGAAGTSVLPSTVGSSTQAIAPLAQGSIAPISQAGAAGGGMDWMQLAAQLGSNYLQDRSLRGAAEDQRAATEAALAEQRRQYDQTRTDFEPWRTAGSNALTQLQEGVNTQPTAEEVMATPGYQFGLTQGQQGIDRRIAAMGGRVSGQAIKAAGRFATDYATTGYNAAYQRSQDRMNRLAAIAGIGQTATGASAAAGQNMANQNSGLISNQGDANAAARIGRGNIWGNTINQFGAYYGRNASRNTGGGYAGQPGWSSDASADPYYQGGP